MAKQLIYIQDSGHGWLEVPHKKLARLGIQAHISRFSYMAGDNAYLEEDCDMGVYLNAVKAKDDSFEFREGHDYRSLYIDGQWVGRDWYDSYYPQG